MSRTPLMVSVSGIRGVVGDSLDPPVILRYTAAYAAWCRAQGAGGGDTVVVGRDGRPSGRMILDLVAGCLTAAGLDAVDLGLCSTPGTAMAVKALGAVGGIVITASHNPQEWNALKFLDGEGDFLSAEKGRDLLVIAESKEFPWQLHDALGKTRSWREADAHHIRKILVLPELDRDRIAAAGFTAVVDAVNASGSEVLPRLLMELGVTVIPLHCDSSGVFPHDPEPKPANLAELSAAVREHGAQIGLAVDPDADRLVLVDESATVLSEEFTLALVADYYLSRRPGPIAVNLSTSRIMDDVAARHDQPCHRSAVGEAHVVAAMRTHGAVLGGEGNGGVIVPDLHAGRDGLVGSALILAAMAASGRSLSALAAALPSYFMEKRRVETGCRVPPEDLHRVASEHLRGELDHRDGVKASSEEGWIHLRPSNTEAILRIIGESADASWLSLNLDAAERVLREHFG